MKLLIPILCLSLLSIGCKATGTGSQPPTPQQIQSAQQINSGLAFGARLAYNTAVVDLSAQHAKGRLTEAQYAKVIQAESLVPPLLDQLDAAAKGEPTSFGYLLVEESGRIADIYLAGGGKP